MNKYLVKIAEQEEKGSVGKALGLLPYPGGLQDDAVGVDVFVGSLGRLHANLRGHVGHNFRVFRGQIGQHGLGSTIGNNFGFHAFP